MRQSEEAVLEGGDQDNIELLRIDRADENGGVQCDAASSAVDDGGARSSGIASSAVGGEREPSQQLKEKDKIAENSQSESRQKLDHNHTTD